MNNKDLRKAFILLSVTFIFFSLAGGRVFALASDTANIEIELIGAYPGHFAEIEMRLRTPVEISGFQFTITLSNPQLFNFHTNSISVENVLMRVDTCTWHPDSLHDSTCFKDSLVPTPVRYCFIDTVGSLISGFERIDCRGETADTSSPSCKLVTAFGYAPYGHHIDPNYPNYSTLFKLGVDVFCIPDSLTDRNVSFYINPQGNSFLSDPQGHLVPFKYNFGTGNQFMTWYSTPGDANGDSTINIGDVTFMINYLYKKGSPPCIPETADCNGSCVPEIGDVTTLINYLFRHGPAPLPGCWYGK